jgi:hypothetical protein
MSNERDDRNAPRSPLLKVSPREPISAAFQNQIVQAVNDLRDPVGPPRQRKPSVSRAPTGIEAAPRVFFCS